MNIASQSSPAIALRGAPRLRLVAAAPEPVEYVSLSPAARAAMAALEGQMNALKRTFAGSFATASQVAEIPRLTEEIRVTAMRVSRLAR